MRAEQNGRETPEARDIFKTYNQVIVIEQQNRMGGSTLSHHRYVFFIFYLILLLIISRLSIRNGNENGQRDFYNGLLLHIRFVVHALFFPITILYKSCMSLVSLQIPHPY